MLPLLVWVPVATSLILGRIYLFAEEGRPACKIIGSVVFLVAVYLQFFSRHALIGLLLQTALALVLAVWRKVSASA